MFIQTLDSSNGKLVGAYQKKVRTRLSSRKDDLANLFIVLTKSP